MPKVVPHLPYYGFSSRESYTHWRHILQPVKDQEYFDITRSDNQIGVTRFPPISLLDYACERPKRKPTLHEDMPFCLSSIIVSARLRNLLERMQPGMIRHQPVHVHCEACMSHGYSQVLTDLELDCFDPHRSRWREEHGTISIHSLAIDPAKVPADAHVFRVKYFGHDDILVTRAFFEEYSGLGMTGCYFPDREWKGPLW